MKRRGSALGVGLALGGLALVVGVAFLARSGAAGPSSAPPVGRPPSPPPDPESQYPADARLLRGAVEEHPVATWGDPKAYVLENPYDHGELIALAKQWSKSERRDFLLQVDGFDPMVIHEWY